MKAKNIIFYGLIAAMMALALTGCPNDTDPSTKNPNTEQTQFDKDGYDKDGFDKNGFNKQGYDREGYNQSGYDKQGFNRDGYDAQGYDQQGIDIDGYDRDGYDAQGYDRQGYDAQGYNRKGLDADGYDKQGFKDGYDRQGLDAQGYDRDGYKNGYDKDGYNKDGFHKDTGIHKVTGTRYNPAGYDKDGNLITEPDPNKPVPPLNDLRFPQYNANWEYSDIGVNLGTAATQLAAQSGEIAERYWEWYNDLKAYQLQDNNQNIIDMISYGGTMVLSQENIRGYITQQTNANSMKTGLSSSAVGLVNNVIPNIFPTPAARQLFAKQVEAFQAAHVIKQRVKYDTRLGRTEEATVKANFTQICQALAQMGGPSISLDDIQGAIDTLRPQLEVSMPEELGPYRNYLIQQWEDFAEFDGLVSDLMAAGKPLTIYSWARG